MGVKILKKYWLVVFMFFLCGCMASVKPSRGMEQQKEGAAVFHVYSDLDKEYNVKGMEKEYLKWIGKVYKFVSPAETDKILEENGLKETADKAIRGFLQSGKADQADVEAIGNILGVKYIVICEMFKFRTKSLIGYEEKIGLGIASLDTATGKIQWKVFDSIGKKTKYKKLIDQITFDYENIKFQKKSSQLQGQNKAAIENINKDNQKSYFSSLEMLTLKKINQLSLSMTAAPAPFATYESRMLRTIYTGTTCIAFSGHHDDIGYSLDDKLGGGIEINYLQNLDFAYYINGDGQAYTMDVSAPLSLKRDGSQDLWGTIGVAVSDPKKIVGLSTDTTIYGRLYWMNPVIDVNLGYGYVFEGAVNIPTLEKTEVSDQICYGVDLVYPPKMYRSSYSVDLAVTGIYFKNWIINGFDVPRSDRDKLYIVPALRLGNMQIMYGKQVRGGEEDIYSIAFSIVH